MPGFFALSINPKTYRGNFLEDLFRGTFYHQHLGEAYGGLSTYNAEREKKIFTRTHRGLFRPNFQEDLAGLEGTEGIGYCGLAREPLEQDSRIGMFSSCLHGNITNRLELIERLMGFGQTFERRDDIEVIVKHIALGDGFVDGIKRMAREVEGAYISPILTSEGIYVVRCPNGHWSGVIGEKKGAVAIASESGGFGNLGFKFRRDLEPGEIVLLKNGHWETKDKILGETVQLCTFLLLYSAFPNAKIEGILAASVKKRLGAILARRDIERGFIPDLVTYIPESGEYYWIGYLQEFHRQMNEQMAGGEVKIKKMPLLDKTLLKYPYAGRGFFQLTDKAEEEESYIKILELGEEYPGAIAVVIDDSIVGGAQARANLVPKLRRAGIKVIEMRIGSPELHSPCRWGKVIKPGKILAQRVPSKKARIRELGIDGLEHATTEDLVEVIGRPREQLCLDCYLEGPK